MHCLNSARTVEILVNNCKFEVLLINLFGICALPQSQGCQPLRVWQFRKEMHHSMVNCESPDKVNYQIMTYLVFLQAKTETITSM